MSVVGEDRGGLQRRQSARRSSGGVGEEEDDYGEPELPGSIPWARKERAMRRSYWQSSISYGHPGTAAMRDGDLG